MGLAYRPEEGYWSAQNWAVAEVREYKTALLQEVISMFGPDGISLDFLRAPLFFNASTTTGEERRSVMGAWVRDLRRRMDAGGVPTLSARIPPKLETLDAIGLDIRGLVADGTLSFLTLGINYDSFMAQDSDIATIRKMVPSNYSLLWEVSYVERAKASATCHHGPDQRMTHAHLATSAHQAYFLGATGMASFNFQYYREFADTPCMLRENEPYSEPPFEVLAKLRDRDWVARQDQFYWSNTARHLEPGSPLSATFVLAPPQGAWMSGKVRINLAASNGSALPRPPSLSVNGERLAATANTSLLWASEFPDRFAGEYLAWTLPATVPRSGPNELVFTADSAMGISHIDVVLPVSASPMPAKADDEESIGLFMNE